MVISPSELYKLLLAKCAVNGFINLIYFKRHLLAGRMKINEGIKSVCGERYELNGVLGECGNTCL